MRVLLRGDLCSNTGYARANRALAALLAPECELVGADIHPDPHDRAARPDFPLVSDQELLHQALQPGGPAIVLHATSPDTMRHIPGLPNIGAFYWETDAVPHRRDWPLKLSLLSGIWAPTSFVAGFARAAGYGGPIDLIPWPHDFADPDAETLPPPTVVTQFIGTMDVEHARPTDVPFPTLRRQARRLFLAVQSLAPRKGTRTLLREWRAYQQAHGGRDVLLLRLAFRHATDIHAPPLAHFARLLRGAGFRPGERTNIALVVDALGAEQLRGLYRHCDAFVTASFGEGFGGPVIEALQEGCLVVAPRHTGLADLLPPGYALEVRSRRVVTGLVGNLDVYPPSAGWHVPEPGALAAALARVAGFTAAQREETLRAARTHAIQFCSVGVVRRRLDAALERFRRPEALPQTRMAAE